MGLCEKALPSNCYVEPCSAPKDNFLFGFGFTPSFPTSPCNVVAKKALILTRFAPNSTLFGVGGEGSLVSVISLERSQHF